MNEMVQPATESKELYGLKAVSYFTLVRHELISLLPPNADRVLEIGAGGGDTLLYIKQNGLAREVVGVDICQIDGSNQTNPQLDRFIIGDLEREDLGLPAAYFDAVILGDVIEHMADPWAALKKIAGLLKPGATIILSTPNFRNGYNFYKIYVQGDFRYDPAGGLLDKTHLRFFCKKNIIDLLDTPEISYESVRAIHDFPQHKFRPIVRLVNLLTFKLFEEFLVAQYIVVGKRRA